MGGLDGQAEVGGELRAAMGRPLTAEELASWLLATPAERQAALGRLHILECWSTARQSSLPFDRVAAMRDLGVSNEGSARNLVAKWRRHKRLRTLGIRTEDRPRTELKALERRIARSVVEKIIRSLRDGSTDGAGASRRSDEWVVRKALADPRVAAAPLSLKLMRRLVGEVRRAAEPKEFGREISIDDVPLSICSPASRAYHCVMLLDKSGLVLAFTLIDRQPDLESALEALRRAADALDDMTLPGFSAAKTRIRVTIPAGGPDDAMSLLRLLARNPGWDIADPSVRGRAATRILGDGLGRIAFRPGLLVDRGLRQCDADIPLVTLEEAEALVRLLVARHNATILPTTGDEQPAVAARRSQVSNLLRAATIARSEPSSL